MIDLRADFLETLQGLLAEIAPECEARVFGSRYRWTASNTSDLDVALVGPGKLPWKTLARLNVALEESVLPFRVDVLDWHAISPEFRKVIEEGYEVIQKRNWENVRFENAPLEIIDGDRGVNYPKQSDFMANGHCLFLNAGNVTKRGFDFSDCSFISEAKDNRLRKGKLTRHDIVLTTRGTVGNLAFYDDRIPFENIRLNSGMVIIRPNKDRIFPRYLYFLLKSSIFKEQVSAFTTGSAQPQLPIRDINRIEFPLPPLPEQRAIAGMLGALDDKIELNQRMNATLESLARAVFRQRFVENEEAQEWNILPLSRVCASIFSGGTPSTTKPEYWNGGIPWLSSGETRERFVIDTDKTISQIGMDHSSTRFAHQGSTVIASAGQGKTRGQTSLLMFDTYINQSVVVLNANKNVVSDLYLFFDLSGRYEEFRQMSDSHSSRGSLTTKLLGDLRITVPPIKLIESFTEFAQPIVEKIYLNLQESRTLASLRDGLLPRLMRGEVRVVDNGLGNE